MKRGKVAKIDKMLIVSAGIFVLTFIVVLQQVLFGGAGGENNKLPEFEVEKKIIEEVKAEGEFRGMFGQKYVDITINNNTVMFTYEEALKDAISKIQKKDFVEFVYLNNEDEKEKRITSIQVKKEAVKTEKPEEKEEAPVDRTKQIVKIYATAGVTEGKDSKKVLMEIHNDAHADQTIYFATAQQYEMIVKDEEGKTVFTYSDTYNFSQGETELKIPAGSKHVFTTELPKLEDGMYQMEAWLTSQNTKELKVEKEIKVGTGVRKEKNEKELSYQTKEGTKTVDARRVTFNDSQEWFVVETAKFGGSRLVSNNYETIISLAQNDSVEKERWDAAEKLKKQGQITELNNKLGTDEFAFYVEKYNGTVYEIAVKNIGGTLYRFESVFNSDWTDSRHEIEAMVQTIK